MNWLNIISKDHSKWISIVNSYGCFSIDEDIVQDMYLKLHKMCESTNDFETFIDKIIKDGKPNGAYIRIVLFNLFLDSKKQEEKRKRISLEDVKELECYDFDSEAFEKRIEEEKLTWQTYDRLLFEIYTEKEFSIRELARQTGIQHDGMAYALRRCKNKMITKFELKDYGRN